MRADGRSTRHDLNDLLRGQATLSVGDRDCGIAGRPRCAGREKYCNSRVSKRYRVLSSPNTLRTSIRIELVEQRFHMLSDVFHVRELYGMFAQKGAELGEPNPDSPNGIVPVVTPSDCPGLYGSRESIEAEATTASTHPPCAA